MFLKTKLVKVTEEKAVEYSAVVTEKTGLLARLVIVENDSKRLHSELNYLTASLKLVESDTLGAFLNKNQFNINEMYAKLPDEIKRLFPEVEVIDTSAKANTANTGTTNMDTEVKAKAVKVSAPVVKKVVVATKGKK